MSGLKFMGQNKITKNAKPVSTITDNDGNDVIRVVDAAPFAYDEDNNAFNVNVISGSENSNVEPTLLWQNEIARKIVYTPNLSWYYPLVDLHEGKFNNYSRDDYPAAINSGGKLMIGPSKELSPVFSLGGFHDNKAVILPNKASLKGISEFTLAGFFEYTSQSRVYHLYNDYVGVGADGNSKVRFSFRINNGKLNALLRFGDAESTSYTMTNDLVLSTGFHHFAVTVDVGNKEVLFYRNGSPLQQTVTEGDWEETSLSSVEGEIPPVLGAAYVADSDNYVGLCENMAHVARFGKVLTQAEILAIAQAGGLGQ